MDENTVGYSKDMEPNPNWREQGLCCQYEHCIENSPLTNPRSELSCYVFGHNCPGGKAETATCLGRAEEVWDNIGPRLIQREEVSMTSTPTQRAEQFLSWRRGDWQSTEEIAKAINFPYNSIDGYVLEYWLYLVPDIEVSQCRYNKAWRLKEN